MDTRNHGIDYCKLQRVYASIVIFDGEYAMVTTGTEYLNGWTIREFISASVALSCL